jgi:uncharacterized membrane protein
MNIILWGLQGLLAATFLFIGIMHLFWSKEVLSANPAMGWMKHTSQTNIRLIGLAEVLGAVGLILPALLNILPGLVAWAALGLGLLMAGAVATHLRLKDAFAFSMVLSVLSLFVFVGRQWVVVL